MNSQIIVIFGASGDLTKRKLMPSLYWLYKHNRLNASFALLGIGRTPYTDETYREFIEKQLPLFAAPTELDAISVSNFLQHIFYYSMDPADKEAYAELKARLKMLDQQISNPGNYLYYLATPPSLYGVIPKYLQNVGLNIEIGEQTRRIIVEKPFGYHLSSAQELNYIYNSVFREDQIYRIDHFLGKETVQNILALRFANGIFEPLWNRNYIDHVEVTAVENLGIEERGGFYDKSGALRDMVQNHLIQLVALTAMEPPALFNADSFRNEVVKVYQALKPLTNEQIKSQVIRGQYTTAHSEAHIIKGYREEKNVDPLSRTETFVATKLYIDNWRWGGVPFFIRTGKQMPTKVTEIIIHFKPTPHSLFKGMAGNSSLNSMIIRIQPNEGIVLKFGLKVPGSNFEIKQVSMDFTYDRLGGSPVGDAYAKLLEDCMLGESTLFTRSDAVEASWKYFDPILALWENDPCMPLYGYPAGTWGPLEADNIMGTDYAWTNPCKNLTNTDLYCEL
ncbi:glucose-6-phosphate dehydrogenase [Microbacter margulisiae]|uniref:Glucose-6-phosphate 1-dehydrogenase n=1 Tax=Microbacter margulisiae TaxID=1350067 RepID=A0A7W5DP25_9PORP|nr:glucose-6-phosphate dehydrogenase [Microbacter margulisiae]MBB3186180.1 glucose-6-phosphate 1-dehydrogenase [Microbacter margulisiae]